MKNIIFFAIITFSFVFGILNSFAQNIGFNTTGALPNSSAMLDIADTSKGLLIPRLTNSQRNNILSPANSLFIFNTTTYCFEGYNAILIQWEKIYCFNYIPKNVSASATPNPVCEGSTLTLLGSATGASSWSWTGPNGFTSSLQNPTITNITTAAAGVYTLTVSNSYGSAAPVSTNTVTINTLSIPVTTTTATVNPICSGSSTNLGITGGSLGTGANWNWYNGACGGTAAGALGQHIVTVAPTVTTTYYLRAEGTCNTTTCQSITIILYTNSVAPTAATVTVSPICSGSTTTLGITGGSLGSGATWQWYSTSCGGTSAGTGATLPVSPTVTTTYYVRAEGTCNTTICQNITVTLNTNSIAATNATITTNPVCSGSTTNLGITGGSLGVGAIWYWYSSSCGGTLVGTGATLGISPTANETYYVRAEGTCNTTTCQNVSVTINTPSVAATTATVTASPICPAVTTTLGITGGSLGIGANWYWYITSCGGTAVGVGTTLSVSPPATTTFFVRAENACNFTICQSVTVTLDANSVAATAVSVSASPICSGSTTTLGIIGGSLGTGADWQWYNTSCNGTSEGAGATLSVTPTVTTTYYVKAEGTCNTTICQSITVTLTTNSVAATTAIVSTSPICPGSSTTLGITGGSLGPYCYWFWYSSSCGIMSAGVGATLQVSPIATTTYWVRAEGACNTTICQSVTVTLNTNSVAATAATVTLSPICTGSTTTLGITGGSLGTGANWQWYRTSCGVTSVGAGATLAVIPTANTTYYVRAEGTCNTTTCQNITVTLLANSVAATTATASPNPICPGSTTTLGITGGTLGAGASWQWYSTSCGVASVGAGATLAIIPTANTTYYVRAEGTCNTTTCQNITVTLNTNSVAATSATATPSAICLGSGSTLGITGGTLGTGANWVWYRVSCGGTFAGVGTLAVTPVVNTTYYVRAEGTCNVTTCQNVTVTLNTNSVAATTATISASPICPGSTTTLGKTGGSLGTGGTWQWYSSSCGVTSVGAGSPLSIIPTAVTTYYVRAEGTCNTTTCQNVSVALYTNSVAATTATATSTSICSGSTTTLGKTGGSLGTGANWQWYRTSCGVTSAGAGATLSVAPTTTTTYYIRAEGTCNTTTCQNITINVSTLPTANIIYAGSPFCNNTTNGLVTLTGTGAYTGGTFSALPAGLSIDASGTINPSASTPGTYIVTYTIAASGGCSQVQATRQVVITALPTASISYYANSFCYTLGPGQSIQLTGTGAYTGGTYSASPSGLTIDASTGAINPSTSTPGITYTVTYTIAAAGGCSQVQATTTITIVGSPPLVPIEATPIISSNQIIWNWNTSVGATGYKYNAVNNIYSSATDNSTSTTFTQTGLSNNTSYTLYIWAYNACTPTSSTTMTETTLP